MTTHKKSQKQIVIDQKKVEEDKKLGKIIQSKEKLKVIMQEDDKPKD